MKPTREPRLDRLDGQLMPDVVRADGFLPHYFAALRKDLPPADLWNHYVISNPGLRLTFPDGEPDKYSDKLMDGKMHREAFKDALVEGNFHETEYRVPFRALVEWGLSKGYVPRAALYSALYAKEPNWRKVAVISIDWRVIDAVYYALGRAPLSDDNLQWYELKPYGLIDEETLLRMASRAIEIKELPAWQEPDWFESLEWRVRPKDFCLWLVERGIVLPEPLNRLANGAFPTDSKEAPLSQHVAPTTSVGSTDVYTDLQTRIVEELSRVPMTGPQLCERLLRIGVNRDESSVKRALQYLKGRGVIGNRRGHGYYLTENPPKPQKKAE